MCSIYYLRKKTKQVHKMYQSNNIKLNPNNYFNLYLYNYKTLGLASFALILFSTIKQFHFKKKKKKKKMTGEYILYIY